MTDTRSPLDRRIDAAKLSADGPPEPSVANMDEKRPYLFSFVKGLGHGLNGLLADPDDFEAFRDGTLVHDPAPFALAEPYRGAFYTDAADALEDDKRYREWESPTAGHSYVLEGPDPQAILMPPAPKVGSAEFAAEIAEVYQMALSRDWGVAGFMNASLIGKLKKNGRDISNAQRDAVKAINADVTAAAERLSHMRWFKGETNGLDTKKPLEQARRRFGQAQTADTLFRGLGEDPWETPFMSQFMVMGSGGATRDVKARATARIAFGAQSVDQRVNVAIPGKDYMTEWLEYLDVQNGANVRRKNSADEIVVGAQRPISTIRDLATYVHDDALYQAYLNAALILLDEGFAFDPGIPFHRNSGNGVPGENREPFALFGGPHLLKLVTSVSEQALKAVRYQKFTIHRRPRPEAAGAMFHTVLSGYEPHRDYRKDKHLKHLVEPYDETGTTPEAKARRQLAGTIARYVDAPGAGTNGSEPALEKILTDIRLHNDDQNKDKDAGENLSKWLLPMAFAEGSPMHPAYGAGHATVAGACVTLLKAFFAMRTVPMHGQSDPVYLVKPGGDALVPEAPTSEGDVSSDLMTLKMEDGLTLESELNKLIWNISNGRNMGGVHYYTDYIESALLGEAVTIGMLREQMLSYHPGEAVSMTVPLLVPRTLPEALLSGQSDLTRDDVVSAVVIRGDGTLARA